MKKIVGISLSLLLLIGAVALSSLNAASVDLNLYWYQLSLPMGFLLLVFAVCGLLCGILLTAVWWVWPAKRQAVHWKRQYNLLNEKQAKEIKNQPENNQLLP